jgi:hypothetical protein
VFLCSGGGADPLCQYRQGKVITIGRSLPSEPKSFVF